MGRGVQAGFRETWAARWRLASQSLNAGVLAGGLSALGSALGGLAVLIVAPAPATAQTQSADLQALDALLRTAESLQIMRLEGVQNARSLGEDLFGNAEDPAWAQALDRVYSVERMNSVYAQALAPLLTKDPALVADVSDFLGSDLGVRVIGLELEARRTALDPIAMGAAKQMLAEVKQTDKERFALIERLVLAGDLIEGNVSSGLNANVAFARSIAAASAPGAAMDEREMLAAVWAQEEEIRASIADYIYPLMALAYAPLTVEELTSYVEFFESGPGKRFNAAMVAAYNPVMIDLSAELGHEAGRLMSGQAL